MKATIKMVIRIMCFFSIILLAFQFVAVYAEPVVYNSVTCEVASTSTTTRGLGLDSGDEYYVMNAKSGKLLSVRSLSDNNGTEIIMRDRYETTNRQWRITSPQSSTAVLTFVDSPTGKVLNATELGVTLNSSIYSAPQ